MTIPAAERQRIADYAVNHPDERKTDIAARFGIARHQLRYILQLVETGDIQVRRETITEHTQALNSMTRESAQDMIAQQCHYAVSQLTNDLDMPVRERIYLLGRLATAERTLFLTRLAGRLNTADAELIVNIIRRFLPNATEDECVSIYEEEKTLLSKGLVREQDV